VLVPAGQERAQKIDHVFGHPESEADRRTVDDPVGGIVEIGMAAEEKQRQRLGRFLDHRYEQCEREQVEQVGQNRRHQQVLHQRGYRQADAGRGYGTIQ